MNDALPRAVLWDLDGTLVDTAAQHMAAWSAVLTPRGVDFTRERFLGTFGRRNLDVLRDLLAEDLSEEMVREIGGAKEEHFRALVRTGPLHMLPGSADWLRRLRETGWRQAIASSAPHANIAATLDGLALHGAFDAIAGEEDVTRGKPDPQIFLAAAAKLGVPPHRAIVVEDAPAGVAAARAAGMRVIGVRTGHGNLEADLVVDTLDLLLLDAFERLLAAPLPLPANR